MAHELAQPGEVALPMRYSWLYLRSSSREESHPPALPDLGPTVSRCPAPVTQSAGRTGPRPGGGQRAEEALVVSGISTSRVVLSAATPTRCGGWAHTPSAGPAAARSLAAASPEKAWRTI